MTLLAEVQAAAHKHLARTDGSRLLFEPGIDGSIDVRLVTDKPKYTSIARVFRADLPHLETLFSGMLKRHQRAVLELAG